jgi:hypothetical protein
MNEAVTRIDQGENAVFGDEVSDEALEIAAGAGVYMTGTYHPTDRCTAPALPPLFIKSAGPI